MLPRAVELVRVLHLRQRLLGCRLICVDSGGSLPHVRLSTGIYNANARSHLGHCSRRQLLVESLSNDGFSTLVWRRAYTIKKVLATSSDTTNNNSGHGNSATSKTKTTKNTATEPKRIMTNTNPAPTAEPTSVTKDPKHQHTGAGIKTKTMEVKTSKGVLSITATIEDSKINDVVFEKTKSAEPAMPKASLSVNEAIVESAKAAAAQLQSTPPSASAAPVPATTTKTTTKMTTTETQATIPQAAEKPRQKIDPPTDTLKISRKAKAVAIKANAKAATAAAAATAKTQTAATPQAEVKPKPKRVLVDFNRSSLERNFITPARAMSDFLLKASDLESLSKIKRRSPYEQEPPMTVYWRKDVEAKAIEVWGSRENLLKETLKRELEEKKHQQNIFTVKRRLRDYRREIGSRTVCYEDEPGLRGKSGTVVLIAIGINGVNFLFKVCGWLFTGSHSMFAESIHSLADTINQLILAYGIHKSTQMADPDHPYGYANMKYVSSLISGVGIFCVGTGLSVYHGITGMMHPMPSEDFFWAFFILGGSLVSEGATLLVAMNEVRRAAKCQGISFKDYVLTGKDPCVNVVLTEDAAAVTSVIVAAACMGLTSYTGMPIFDAVGSLLVGSILGGVASFIIYTNVAALVGKSISEEHLNKINAELESDVMIRAIHDVKGIDMGNSLVRYKAEMDFDGRELTRSYLDKQDLNELLKAVKSFQTMEELEQFLLKHGECIVDLMGGEIDRIEMKLRKKFPEIRHCDLEIL